MCPEDLACDPKPHNMWGFFCVCRSRCEGLENRIRETFGLEGTPIRLVVRERGEQK